MLANHFEHTRNSLTVAVCKVSGVYRATSLALVPLSRNECARTMAPGDVPRIRPIIPMKRQRRQLLTWQVMIAQQELKFRISTNTRSSPVTRTWTRNSPCSKQLHARTPSRPESLNYLSTRPSAIKKRKIGIARPERGPPGRAIFISLCPCRLPKGSVC